MKEKALKLHENGKISIESRVKLDNAEDLALAYTPGVAFPCLEIANNPELAYKYTSKSHMVLIVTDGTAVLGLGDIGPQAALPVMEGKALLLKKFAGLDCFPICLDTKDVDKIVETVKIIAPSCGAIILEDISAPRCVAIERRLRSELKIPVFHDDQHGTAIVVGAALINACRLLNKNLDSLRIVVSGTGAAGSSVMRILHGLGVKTINAYNAKGVVDVKKYNEYNFIIQELLDEGIIQTPEQHDNTLKSIMIGADVFIGLSAPNLVDETMVRSMNQDAIVFALANPTPEVMPDVAKAGGARIIGTGRSDFPNQINNVLAFPGIFKGALAARAEQITEDMKLITAKAIAALIKDEELKEDYIIPSAFDMRVVDAIANAIIEEVNKTRS
jgi:malate dehydrogenase (oxaloacetate-decarboxylating)